MWFALIKIEDTFVSAVFDFLPLFLIKSSGLSGMCTAEVEASIICRVYPLISVVKDQIIIEINTESRPIMLFSPQVLLLDETHRTFFMETGKQMIAGLMVKANKVKHYSF